jgi:AcrR family transcriptional regulator
VSSAAPSRTTRGEQTRQRILDAALGLFTERGYEATTMRNIAEAAGVALGNSYYYFPSKEHLVQAFYERLHEQHRAAVEPVLATERTLRRRLLGVSDAFLELIEPYHPVAGVLFRTAADPQSPINPFSELSRPTREAATAIFAEVVEGSTARIPGDLAPELPRLLWTWHMGTILFWIHDRSPHQERTRQLTDESADLIVRLLNVAQLPLMRHTRRRAVALVRSVLSPDNS